MKKVLPIHLLLLFTLVLIFLVLAAQFESFIDPLIIMITVPLALAGAIITLSVFGQTLNIFSQIGIIMLIGLVTKNGILIVEFANQKRKAGEMKVTAAIDSAVARMRPILMTTLATTLGALPIALAIGSAGKSRIPLGLVMWRHVVCADIDTLCGAGSLFFPFPKKKISYDEMAAVADENPPDSLSAPKDDAHEKV
jgi:multidrug efflux pump subunit AcrB